MDGAVVTQHNKRAGTNLRSRDLLTWALLLISLTGVVGGITSVLWGLEFRFLFSVAVVAMTLQWALALLRAPDGLAAALGGVVGVEYVLVRTGRLGPLLVDGARASWTAFRELLVWLWGDAVALLAWIAQVEWRAGRGLVWEGAPVWAIGPDWGALATAWMAVWDAFATLLQRGRVWLVSMSRGEDAFDAVAATLAWSMAIWALASWAGWVVRRRHKPLLGLLPAGATLGFVISYTGGQIYALLPLLFGGLLLLAMNQHHARELGWRERQIRYSNDLWGHLFWIAVPLSLLLILAAVVTPRLPTDAITEWIEDAFDRQDLDALTDSLGMEPQPQEVPPVPVNPGPGPGLPTDHVITAGPQLTNRTVMFINVGDAEPLPDAGLMDFDAPVYRWRGYTYDIYTGRGWTVTDTQEIAYDAGAPLLDTDVISHHTVLRQTVRRVGDRANIVHVAGALVALDQDYEATWRTAATAGDGSSADANDLFGADANDFFGATADSRSYRANSLVPEFTERDLRQTGTEYPGWLLERYTQLPDGVPTRVITLAQRITEGAPTPYDRALMIESYMRTFTYTLDVPGPPPGREVADFFLFDLREGYCDYYATSMVVLARAVGLPTRVVIGYVGGVYDPMQAHYAVAEADAHAWVEVYFPGYGWIEFEPTAGRPSISRRSGEPGGSDLTVDFSPPDIAELDPLVPEAPEPTATPWAFSEPWPAWLVTLLVALALVALALAVSALDVVILLLRHAPATLMAHLYRRLRRYAVALRAPIREGDTPHELAESLILRIAEVARDRQAEDFVAPAADELRAVVDGYVQTRYTPRPLDAAESRAIAWIWWKLRWRVWLAWFWRGSETQIAAQRAPAVVRWRP